MKCDSASVPTLRGRGIICEAVPSIMISQKERLELAEKVLHSSTMGEQVGYQ